MVEHFNGDQELINLINTFNYMDQSGSNMWTFENIACNSEFPDDNWGLKVLWDTVVETCQHMNTKKGI